MKFVEFEIKVWCGSSPVVTTEMYFACLFSCHISRDWHIFALNIDIFLRYAAFVTVHLDSNRSSVEMYASEVVTVKPTHCS